jgi:signal peptidase I
MRNINKKTVVFLIFFIVSTFFNNFYLKNFNANIFYIIFWALVFVSSIILLGYRKDKNLNKVDVIQIVFIYCVTYLILTYIGGIAVGYYKNLYSLNFIKIIENIFPLLILIILEELVRYNIISKEANKFVIFLLIMLFVSFDILTQYNAYNLSTSSGIFELIGYLILPSIITNALLTFMTEKSGYLPSITYRIILELYIYLVPIIPDYGVYIQSLLNIIFPLIMFLKINTIYAKETYKARTPKRFVSIIITIPLMCILIALVGLISGVFSYYMMAIASNSMVPTFSRGDAVIVQKIKTSEIENIEVGDIIVYYHDQKMIVHRVVSIKKTNGGLVFNTKGDNNEDKDNWDITESNIKGVVKKEIKYIGYPSIWLEEKLESK